MCGRCDDLGGEVRGPLAGVCSLLLTCGFLGIELRLVGKHPSQVSHRAGPFRSSSCLAPESLTAGVLVRVDCETKIEGQGERN